MHGDYSQNLVPPTLSHPHTTSPIYSQPEICKHAYTYLCIYMHTHMHMHHLTHMLKGKKLLGKVHKCEMQTKAAENHSEARLEDMFIKSTF